MITLLIIFLLGVLTPIQTSANSRLRQYVGTPLVASLVSFTIGSIYLAVATLIDKGTLSIASDTIVGLPWWGWLGGICGLYGLTVNIVIFPKLGSVQTVLMPMLGQIATGILIDTFGWFNAPIHELNATRIAALCLILGGIIMVIHKKEPGQTRQRGLLPWQIVGFSGGAVFTLQPPMNSLLSHGLGSAIHAALISFTSATVVLLTIVVTTSANRRHITTIFSLNRPRWTWLGGIIGGTVVTGFAFFTEQVGVGIMLVTAICGMLTMSLIIDRHGLLGATKKRIVPIQYAGLLLTIAGIALLRLC